MSLNEMMDLWWTVPAGLALLGYALSLTGLTPAQRAVWTTARIVAVEQPAHGASKYPGIPVTVAFPHPAGGHDVVLPNTGKHGHTLTEAWVGREVTVRHPRGRPDRFRVVIDSVPDRSGRGAPNCAVALLLVGLVVHATVLWGYPWALLGFGALVTVFTATGADLRNVRVRDALLSSAVAVPGRVVAVTRDVHTDGEGEEIVNHAPVIVFTTAEGTRMTVLCREGVPNPRRSLGRDLTIHYAPTAPRVYTPDLAAEHRDNEGTLGAVVLVLIAGAGATVTGAVLVGQQLLNS